MALYKYLIDIKRKEDKKSDLKELESAQSVIETNDQDGLGMM